MFSHLEINMNYCICQGHQKTLTFQCQLFIWRIFWPKLMMSYPSDNKYSDLVLYISSVFIFFSSFIYIQIDQRKINKWTDPFFPRVYMIFCRYPRSVDFEYLKIDHEWKITCIWISSGLKGHPVLRYWWKRGLGRLCT